MAATGTTAAASEVTPTIRCGEAAGVGAAPSRGRWLGAARPSPCGRAVRRAGRHSATSWGQIAVPAAAMPSSTRTGRRRGRRASAAAAAKGPQSWSGCGRAGPWAARTRSAPGNQRRSSQAFSTATSASEMTSSSVCSAAQAASASRHATNAPSRSSPRVSRTRSLASRCARCSSWVVARGAIPAVATVRVGPAADVLLDRVGQRRRRPRTPASPAAITTARAR